MSDYVVEKKIGFLAVTLLLLLGSLPLSYRVVALFFFFFL